MALLLLESPQVVSTAQTSCEQETDHKEAKSFKAFVLGVGQTAEKA
jgi:hypothetical protein